ncbi:N-acetyltransferase 10 [Bonamia ostreae]|uniref:N-acetyltransferase 10 n=1 Tax=Bonamia ostreae TaxID=126728 RepID=A0ABV2ASZ0_9EUKA
MPLKEITLEEPIRYSSGDGVEKWLNSLLCLDNPNYSNLTSSVPHPSKCELCLIDRDKLFSGHPAAEVFLAKIMALYSSAHYRNSPNDLQLISDVPTHRLFALINKNYDKNGFCKINKFFY